MALPPEATSDAFVREVDEELRRDQALTLWNRYGKLAIVLIVAGLIALGGWLYWQSRQEAAAGVEGENFATAIKALETGNSAAAVPALDTLATSKVEGNRASAQLALAAAAMERGDLADAKRRYAAIAADTGLDPAFRDLATIRQTAAEYDSLTPAQVIDRLRPLAVPGNAYHGSAAEMTGIALMRLGRAKAAGEMFAGMARDTQVPESLRQRAVQLAAANGVDATQESRPAR